MGGGVPQILGRIARSPGGLLGKGEPTSWQKGKGIMCPVCLANIALFAVGATSSGGLVAFTLSKFCRKKQTETKGKQNETNRETNGNRIGS